MAITAGCRPRGGRIRSDKHPDHQINNGSASPAKAAGKRARQAEEARL